MKEANKAHAKDFIALLVTVCATVLVCNCLTPILYNHFVGNNRTALILNKLKDPGFAPDLVVFGSSKSLMGIDGFQMSDELGIEVYNFSSVGQPSVESSLYYEMLPPSVKTVVQIIFPPLKFQTAVSKKTVILHKSAAVSFTMEGYHLSEATKKLNPYYDLTDLEKNYMERNFMARGSIFIPSLSDWLRNPSGETVKDNLKFDNTYPIPRHKVYEKTIEDEKNRNKKYYDINGNIEIDTADLTALNGYSKYLNGKGIKMVVVIMPTNPDLKEFTVEQMQLIDESCKELMPDVTFFNYLSAIEDPTLFYDAAHMNRDGAKAVTALLDRDLKELLGGE